MISSRQLFYFQRIAELGSFTAAADALHVSQPALGQQIRKLEAQLGAPLFERHARGVALTLAGRILLDHAGPALSAIEAAEAAVRKIRDVVEGRVSVGAIPAVGRGFVPELLERCRQRYPHIRLTISEGMTDMLTHAMALGQLSFALTGGPGPASVETIAIATEPLFLIGPASPGEPAIGTVRFSDLVDYPMIVGSRRNYRLMAHGETTKRLSEALDIRYEVDATALSAEFIERSGCYTIVGYSLFDAEYRTGHLSARMIVEPEYTRTVYLLGPGEQDASAAERAVRGVILEIAADAIADGHWYWRTPTPPMAGAEPA